jgi:ATPase subunit of ABC transporter with duplicated ATPase domains
LFCCKGVLGSHPRGRDVHIHQFSVTFHGQEILVDTDFEMNCGRRYGLVGLNGSGKSTILACIGNREVNSKIFLKETQINFSKKTTTTDIYLI